MKIFIVNGKGTAGKSTFETMVKKIADNNKVGIKILSTIDYVKKIAKTFGWNNTKELKDRKMLSNLKDLLTEWNDIPHKKICQQIEHYKNMGYNAIFIDSRDPEDIKRFVKEYHALTLLIKRDTINLVYGNHADDCVEDYDYDIVIDNSRGLKELQEEAKIFYETFIKEEK